MQSFPRSIETLVSATSSAFPPRRRSRADLSNLLAALLAAFMLASLLPPSVAAQPAIDPAAIALTPADLPPGFAVVPEESGSEPFTQGRGVMFHQVMRRERTQANLYSGPISVSQVILRVDEVISFAGVLDYVRQEAITKDGFSPVPGAPNDGGTASLMKHEGEFAAFEVGFIKANMIVFTRWIGLASVVNLPGVLTLAGVSSARYDSVLAGLSRPATAQPAAPPPAPPPPPSPPPPSQPARPAPPSAIPAQIHASLAPAWRALTGLPALSSGGEPVGTTFRRVAEGSGVRITVGPLNSAWGSYRGRDNTITIEQRALGEDPRALAAVLAHELIHVSQVAKGYGTGNFDCVGMEAQAHLVGATVWAMFWNGYGPNRTALEQDLNRQFGILTTQGEPGFYKYVVDQPGYQAQCDLWAP